MNECLKYDRHTVDNVKKVADIRDYIPGCTRKAEQMVECPFCHSKKMSVVHKGDKNFAHCFSCGKSIPNAIDAVMTYEGLEWLPALESVAQRSGIPIVPLEQIRMNRISDNGKSPDSFCSQQLAASGLTQDDVCAKIIDSTGREDFFVTFRKGGIDPPFSPNSSDDEMLIYYFGLDGRQKSFVPRGNGGRAKPYFRVRWSNPAAHTDADGKATKYKTPAGAPSQVYIPQFIRTKYQAGEHIETLFLQEGEKKAEKACKHGIPSIGIQGINNFGTAKDGLLQDIQYIVKECAVKNVVLLMDSDWEDLHKNIISGDSITKRPNSFSKAVIKFKMFIRSLSTLGFDADVWWGHVNLNDGGDKGIDDLLCNSLLGHEDELLVSIDEAMHAHNGQSKWVNIHKITSVTDKQIEDFWLLNDDQAFYERHAARLSGVETFKIKNIRYKVEDGRLVQVNRYSSDVDIWAIELDSKEREKVIFNTLETFEFLKANGFYRMRNVNGDGTVSFDLIRIDDGIIDRTSPVEIRDFIRDYINGTCRKKIVKNFFHEKMDSVMADKKMENLARIENDFNDFVPETQRLYFNNGTVEITSRDIIPNQPMCNVWRSRIVPRKFRRVPIIRDIRFTDGRFYIELTPEGERCEFLRYLFNTSNSFYTHDSPRELTPEEQAEYFQHIVNKITAIGFLLCDYKFPSEKKAVVVQDHRMAEVGQSNGGSGKSILGNAIGHIIPQVFIDGKADDSDRFFFDRVSHATRNVFIDDIRANFNFERLFAMVTGDMIIPRKNTDPLEIRFSDSPKIILTTNHAINKAEEDATRLRIIYIEASEWYNPDHTLVDDFDHMFFDDWSADDQWVLFDNLMAECVIFYLRSFDNVWYKKGMGAVPPPMENIRLRSLRQEMSEALFQWAEEYYDPCGQNLNERRSRKDLFTCFCEYAGTNGHGVSRSNFRRKIEAYCKFKGYDFNINQPDKLGNVYSQWKPSHQSQPFIGESDKSGGVEYFTVFLS
ncbi:MAG: hypothetical protein HDS09_05515 [Bacteroides sp.]|nr:hypothetical protein [Bacteroides sp.]